MELVRDTDQGLKIGAQMGIAGNCDKRNGAVGPLELRGDGGAAARGGHRKGDEGGRYIELVEGAGHAVLTADGGQLEGILHVIGAEQGAEGLAPAGWVVGEFFKVLLQREANIGELSSG